MQNEDGKTVLLLLSSLVYCQYSFEWRLLSVWSYVRGLNIEMHNFGIKFYTNTNIASWVLEA